MNSRGDASSDYPFCLDTSSLPPNHNRFIGAVPAITMDNLLGALALIQKMIDDSPHFELSLSQEETAGLYSLVDTMRKALRFEVCHRRRGEQSSAADDSSAGQSEDGPPEQQASSG